MVILKSYPFYNDKWLIANKSAPWLNTFGGNKTDLKEETVSKISGVCYKRSGILIEVTFVGQRLMHDGFLVMWDQYNACHRVRPDEIEKINFGYHL